MKTILITGSTDGIGKLTALQLAKEGHTVYVHGRNAQKVEATVKAIAEVGSLGRVEGFVADLSQLNEVDTMAKSINSQVSKLDVLINNAGVFKSQEEQADNGVDLRLVVNYLAPVLLTEQLLPLLQQSDAPRIINLSSAAQAPVSLEALRGEASLGTNEAYAQSKLALTMWSFEFAKKHPNIVTLAVNPGSLLNTKMAKEAYGQHWSPASKGVDILYSLAMDSIHADKTGQYFDNDRGGYNMAHADAYDEDKIAQLMQATHQLV